MSVFILFGDKTRGLVVLTPLEYLPGDHPIHLIFPREPNTDLLESFSRAKTAAYNILIQEGWSSPGDCYAFFCEIKDSQGKSLIHKITGRSCELPIALALIRAIMSLNRSDPLPDLTQKCGSIRDKSSPITIAATGIISEIANGTIISVDAMIHKLNGAIKKDPLPPESKIFYPSDNQDEIPENLSAAAKSEKILLTPVSDLKTCAKMLPGIQEHLATAPVVLPIPCPYKGLFSFQEEDASFFFGRESFIIEFANAVFQKPLVTLIGASGSGKSSVIFAGLIPYLRKNGKWHIAAFRPKERPFFALAKVLIPLLEPHLSKTDQLIEIGKLAQALRQKEILLRDVTERILKEVPLSSHFLLVADQFEELYTLCQNDDERKDFLDILLATTGLPQDDDSLLRIVLGLRADFLGPALAYRPFADALQHADLKLGPMNYQELQSVIEAPARQSGVELEKGLTSRILEIIGEDPGNLPLLEFLLTLMWEKQKHNILSHEAYEAVGGVKNALVSYAENIYEKLTQEERKAARDVFLQLISPGQGTEDTRRLAIRNEIGETSWNLITRLADKRLIVINRTETETAEVVHEALIKEWDRLRGWIDRDRNFRIWQERLRADMLQWENKGKDDAGLLRGIFLAEANALLEQRSESVRPAEKVFIKASLAFQEKRRTIRERQKRNIISGLLVGLILTLVLMFFAGWQWHEAEKQQQIAISEKQEAEEQRSIAYQQTENAKTNAIRAMIRTAQASFLSNDELGALLAGVKSGIVSKQTNIPLELKHQIIFNLREVIDGIHEKNRLENDESRVRSICFSLDNQMLASGNFDGTILFWNTDNGQQIKILKGHTDIVHTLSFSPDGKILASGGSDKKIILWNIENAKITKIFDSISNALHSLCFSPDGTLLVSNGGDKDLLLWDVEKGTKINTFKGHSDTVYSVAFSPDGNLIASGSKDNTVRIWRVADGQTLRIFKGHSDMVYSVCFNPDGNLIASGSKDHSVRLWNMEKAEDVRIFKKHSGLVYSVSFSPDGKMVASGGRDNVVRLWDVKYNYEIRVFKGHQGDIYSVSFSPDGKMIASGSRDDTIRLWRLKGSETVTLKKHSDMVYGLSFSPDNRILVSGSLDGTIILWDIRKKRMIKRLRGDWGRVYSVHFSPDGRIFASGHRDGIIRLWDRENMSEIRKLRWHLKSVYSVCFSPDGKYLASGGEDNTVRLWDIKKGAVIKKFIGHSDSVFSVCFSPDGKYIASGSDDQTVRLWNIKEGTEGRILKGHLSFVNSVSFSPNGKYLASGSDDNTIRLWNLNNENNENDVRILRGHTNAIYTVTFSPDSKILASGGWEKIIVLWNVEDGKKMKQLEGHYTLIRSLVFSPDGNMLASGSGDRSIKLWNLNLDDLLLNGCQWLYDYLKNNPYVNQEDRFLCDEVIDR